MNYHATGKQIFKGRLIAFAIFVFYGIVTSIFPLTAILFLLAFLIALPWIINRSLRFSARMTSWRNVRLNWHGSYGKTLLVLVLMPSLGALSLGILVPWITRTYYKYYAEGHSFGTQHFKADASVSEYYKGFFVGLIFPAIVGVILYLLISSISTGTAYVSYYAVGAGLQGAFIGFFVFAFLLNVIYGTICRNILVRSLSLGETARFYSNLNPYTFMWIAFSNVIATVLSLGLLLPWAMVRSYKYLATHTAAQLQDGGETFIDEQTDPVGAFGEEFAEMDGIDIGL